MAVETRVMSLCNNGASSTALAHGPTCRGASNHFPRRPDRWGATHQSGRLRSSRRQRPWPAFCVQHGMGNVDTGRVFPLYAFGCDVSGPLMSGRCVHTAHTPAPDVATVPHSKDINKASSGLFLAQEPFLYDYASS